MFLKFVCAALYILAEARGSSEASDASRLRQRRAAIATGQKSAYARKLMKLQYERRNNDSMSNQQFENAPSLKSEHMAPKNKDDDVPNLLQSSHSIISADEGDNLATKSPDNYASANTLNRHPKMQPEISDLNAETKGDQLLKQDRHGVRVGGRNVTRDPADNATKILGHDTHQAVPDAKRQSSIAFAPPNASALRHKSSLSTEMTERDMRPTSTTRTSTTYTPTLESLKTITTLSASSSSSSSSSIDLEPTKSELKSSVPTQTQPQEHMPPLAAEPEPLLDSKIYAAAVHESLEVRDTSFAAAPALSEMLQSRPDMARVVDQTVLFGAHPQHTGSQESPQDDVHRVVEPHDTRPWVDQITQKEAPIAQMGVTNSHGEPFLFPGQERARTPRNCYIVHLDADADPNLLQTIEDITVTIFHALVKERYDAQGGISGCTLCFPDGTLPLALLRSISGVRWVERDQFSIGVNVSANGDKNFSGLLDAVDHGVHQAAEAVASRMMAMRMSAAQDGEKSHTHEQEDAPWQLGRIANPRSQPSDPYRFSATGKGVTVYVIDSGVLTAHNDFSGRARLGFSTFASGFPQDCSGHGTQVSSVVAGTNVGVAKRANVIGVQILDCTGQGENSSVIAAINWIISTHKKPAVINMSVGGPKSISVDAAVSKAVARGIPVVVAAGNSGVDACGLSPSGVPASIAVGASTFDNQRAAFSNYGSCVDVFAPGRQVVAAAIPSQAQHNGFALVSGTSLSAPMVSGIYALVLERMPEASPSELRKLLLAAAVSGVLVERTLRGSPNLLAQIVPIEPARDEDALNIMFLPRGSLPAPGAVSNSVSVLEIVLLSLAGACGCVVSILVILVLVRRRLRKRRELELRTVPSVFR